MCTYLKNVKSYPGFENIFAIRYVYPMANGFSQNLPYPYTFSRSLLPQLFEPTHKHSSLYTWLGRTYATYTLNMYPHYNDFHCQHYLLPLLLYFRGYCVCKNAFNCVPGDVIRSRRRKAKYFHIDGVYGRFRSHIESYMHERPRQVPISIVIVNIIHVVSWFGVDVVLTL